MRQAQNSSASPDAAALEILRRPVKALAGRLDRDVRQSYTDGFEAGVAFAVADEARRSEPRRKVVERNAEGRIIAITG